MSTYYREDETRQLIENWKRWNGDGAGTPTSRTLCNVVLEAQEKRRSEALPASAIIGEDARVTDLVGRAMEPKLWRLLTAHCLVTTSLAKLGKMLRVSARYASTLLHQAHSDFWEAHRKVSSQADAKRRGMASTQPKLLTKPGTARPIDRSVRRPSQSIENV